MPLKRRNTMLNKLRKPGRAKSITAYVIFGAICLVFVFFGLTPGQSGFQGGGAAAIVNNSVISLADFKQRVQMVEQQYEATLGGMPAAQRQGLSRMIRERALNDLIAFEVISQAADEVGVTVADAEVRSRILSIPQFQEEGRFRREYYNRYLEYVRMSPAEFEEKIRKEISFNHLQDLFHQALAPVQGEVENEQVLRQAKANLSFIKVGESDLQKAAQVSDVAVNEYLAQEDGLKAAQERYEANKEEYSVEEQVKAKHILIQAKPDDEQAQQEALGKIKKIKSEISGDNFGELAKKHSEDKVSAEKNGDLGYFSRGRMVPAFEEVAFNLPVGEVSEPIKTQFGYHLIKVEDKKAATTKSFDQVKSAIARNLLVEKRAEEMMGQLQGLAKAGDMNAVEAKAKELGLKWQDTGEFELSRANIPKLGNAEKVLDRALELGQPGELVPELVEVDGQGYLVKLKALQVPEKLEAGDKKMEERMFAMRRSSEAFDSWYQARQEKADIERNLQLLSGQQ